MRRLATLVIVLLLLNGAALHTSYADGGYGIVFEFITYEQLLQQQEMCNESQPSTAHERSAAFNRLGVKFPEFVAFHRAWFPALTKANNWPSSREMRKQMEGKFNCKDISMNVDQLANRHASDWQETRKYLQRMPQSLPKDPGG